MDHFNDIGSDHFPKTISEARHADFNVFGLSNFKFNVKADGRGAEKSLLKT